MTVLRTLAREQRAIQATAWGEWASGSTTWSGNSVSTTSSLQLLTVYGCVRLIADSIATLPVDTYRVRPDGEQEEITPPRWLVQPTPYLDRTAWLTQVLTSLLLDGNSYCYVIRDTSTGAISELLPIDPTIVKVEKQPGQAKAYLVGGKPFAGYEILHIPAVMFPGSSVGLSPVEAARQSIGMGMAAQEYGGRFFGQGATQTGVIEVPGTLPQGKPQELAQQWERRHSGKAKAHLPGVLEGGATWKSTAVTNEQAQFLETRRYTAAEIAGQMFLVDPSELGIGVEGTSLTYANLEQRKVRLASVTLQPWIVRLETALSALLANPRFMKFNMAAFLRADAKTQAETFQIGIRTGYLLRSEVRDLLDLPVIPGIDDAPLPAAITGGSNAPAA